MLFAQLNDEKLIERLLQPQNLVFVVGLAAIVVFGFTGLVRSLLRHKERMAMIRSGMNPNAVSEDHESDSED